MFGGGDQNALSHEAGGIADARHIAPIRRDVKIIEVRSDENDAGRDRGGLNADLHLYPAVKTHAGRLYRPLHRSLKTQEGSPSYRFPQDSNWRANKNLFLFNTSLIHSVAKLGHFCGC